MILIISVFIASICSYGLSATGFYLLAAHLEDEALGGPTALDRFLRFSVVGLMICLAIALSLLLPVRVWSRTMATVLFGQILIHHGVSLLVYLRGLTDNFKGFFAAGSIYGSMFQQVHGCCGWIDTLEAIGNCTFHVPCRPLVTQIIDAKRKPIVCVMVAALLCDLFCVVGSAFVAHNANPSAPKFQQLISSPNKRRNESLYV